MAATDLQQLAAAHRAACAAETGAEERARANRFIEDAKVALGSQGVSAGFALAASAADAAGQHFGLHIAEDAIEMHWERLSEPERAAARQQSMAALAAQSTESPGFLREKVAQVAAAIAKREWPERWQGWMPELSASCAIGPGPAETVLRVFRVMLEDLAEGRVQAPQQPQRPRRFSEGAAQGPHGVSRWEGRKALSADRRRELVDAVRRIAPDLCGFLATCLDGAQEQTDHAMRRAILATQCAAGVAELCPCEVVWGSRIAAHLAAVSSSFDASAPRQCDLRSAQLSCAAEVLSHPLPATCDPAVAQTFAATVGACCAAVRSLAGGQVGAIDSEDTGACAAHTALHRATAAVAAAVQHNFAALAACSAGGASLVADTTDALLSALRVPCVSLALEALVPLRAALTHDALPAGIAERAAPLPDLLRERLAASVAVPDAADSGSEDGGSSDGEAASPFPAATYSELHFDTLSDWRRCFEDARRAGRAVLAVYAGLARQAALQRVAQWAVELSERFAAPLAGDPTNGQGNAARVSRQVVAWESAEFATACVMSYFQSLAVKQLEGLLQGALGAAVEGAVRALLAYAPADPNVMAPYCGLLCAFAPCLQLSTQLLGDALAKVFALMEFRRDVERGAAVLTKDTAAGRMRVQRAFVRLCATMPQHLIPATQQLVAAASRLVGGSALLDGEVACLFEGLVTVSNHLPPADQASLLSTITAPTVAEWANPQHPSVQAISSPQALLAAVGATPAPAGVTDDSLRLLRAKALQLLNVLVGVFRNARPASAAVSMAQLGEDGAPSVLDALAPQVAPPALQAVRALDALWGDSRGAVPADLQGVLAISEAEAAQHVSRRARCAAGAGGGWDTAPGAAEQRRGEVGEIGRAFFRDVRELCCELLGCIAGATGVLHAHWDDWVRPGLLSQTAALDLRHLRPLLLHFAPNFVFSCPDAHFAAASAFCIGLHTMVADKLAEAYAAIGAGQGGALYSFEGSTPEMREVLAAKVAGQVARLACGTQQRLGRTIGGGDAGRRRSARLEAMARVQLLQDARVAGAMLALTSRALGWVDPGASVVALTSCLKLVRQWLMRAELAPLLCHLFGSCLKRLVGARLRVDDGEALSGLIGADSKEDELIQECIAAVQLLYSGFRQSGGHQPLQQLLARVAPAEQIAALDAELASEQQEGRRVAAVRKLIVASVLGRNCTPLATPVSLPLPAYRTRGRSDLCWFDPANLTVALA
eukprot:TRINITY_DN15012_c0_g1_i2.p1 TRINITY_DN15012_c0_g1~~TRINITY_DN15012_c0_g1_i2.p1  ORF type:complete len:1230 (+),score=356.60 TRINITY_DN15012_c0_g1_i2:86-3775(+)